MVRYLALDGKLYRTVVSEIQLRSMGEIKEGCFFAAQDHCLVLKRRGVPVSNDRLNGSFWHFDPDGFAYFGSDISRKRVIQGWSTTRLLNGQ